MNDYRIGTWRAAVAAALWLLALLPPPPVAAQQAVGRDVGPVLATRAQLRDGLARLERDSRSRGEVTLVRSRLETGDFQEGDRILVHVEGEQQLSDTFTVGFGPELRFPQLGAVSLAGVLRSELQSHLTTFLEHYIQAPVVQARPLIRVLVEGNVARPGFYAVPPQLPLADIIGVAGGLAPQGKVSGMHVERGHATIWNGELLQLALGRGATLDELSLRGGDRVFVPGRGDTERTIRLLGLLVTVPVAVFTLTQVFK